MDSESTSGENSIFLNEVYQKKLKTYFDNEDYFALFYIYANFLEFTLKLTLVHIHTLEESMLHFISEGKIDTHDAYPKGGTLGKNIDRLKKYKINNLDGVKWEELIEELGKFNKIRIGFVHHLYKHTSIENFEEKLKEGVAIAQSASDDLNKITEYICTLTKKSLSEAEEVEGKILSL